MFRTDHEWLTPAEAAALLPGTSALSMRKWCRDGKVPDAVQLPSGRWQIPYEAVVKILGRDPRRDGQEVGTGDPGEAD